MADATITPVRPVLVDRDRDDRGRRQTTNAAGGPRIDAEAMMQRAGAFAVNQTRIVSKRCG
jgi:hypothetical protein